MSTLEFNDLPVEIVSVEMTISFVGFAVAGEDREARDLRIMREIADAIEYRAAHGTDTEDGDGLIATMGEVTVGGTVTDVTSAYQDVTVEDVAEMAVGTSGSI